MNDVNDEVLPQPATLLKKETLTLMLSCEFCEISKNTFSYRTPLVAAVSERSMIDIWQGCKYASASSHPEVFCKKGVLLRNFIKKETLVQMFSCEFWEISKKTFSYRTPPMAASEEFMHCTFLQETHTIFIQQNY